mgnify:CR=1 FL=1
MLKFKILIYFLLVFILANFVNAATIYGTVYDLSLKKANNARVEINTSPKQFMIAQNGTYSFEVPNGAYTIKAQLMQKNTVIASISENITIKQPGNYVLDLILFPDVEEGVEDIDIDVNGEVIEADNNIIFIFLIVLLLITIGVIYHVAKNKKQKKEPIKEEKTEEKGEENDDLQQLINIIKQEGGRATQKDIRKLIPLSEAKISLMVAELEHKGIIEKIKKGRGNIIILKKK